ncbi:MAG: ferritin-like domain-containing protein [Clostridia bacterium]|nr:ferritin-like domain-containing protein [Clostridia bacterium]
MNTLSSKETSLLKDLKGQEQLCIDKYTKYSTEAKSTVLSQLFSSMAKTEENHLKTINEMMSGNVPVMPQTLENSNNQNTSAFSYTSEEDKKHDAFLCTDMLATEKHASALYDVSVFEFVSPENRRTLNHIQAEEQQHGEQLYKYMNNNNMYN